MANNSKNSKQTESKQFKNVSNQQENQLKKGKITKHDPSDSILISKQLMQKRSSSKTRRHKRKTTSTHRILPMPTLADLEKMFEDSDDDVVHHKSTDAKQQSAPKCNAHTSNITETLMIPKVMVTDVLLSATKSNRIEEQFKEKFKKTSSSSLDDIEITYPSRKRLNTHEESVESDDSDDLPPVNIGSKKARKNSITVENVLCQNKTKESMIPVKPEVNTERLKVDAGNDDSLNKLKSTSNSEVFSPIPSTSQSNEVLNRNENLMESSTGNDSSLTKEQPLKRQMPNTENTTIVIEDEPMKQPPTDVKTVLTPVNQITPNEAALTTNRQVTSEDDDDCIIVETSNTINNTIREPTINNTESTHTSNPTEHARNEIIDVDALIARNQSMIVRYNPLNIIIDVDLLPIAENTNSPSGHTTNNSQSQPNGIPDHFTISINMNGQPSNDDNLEHIRTDSNMHSQPSTQHQIDDRFHFHNIRMSEERYRNLMALQGIGDSHVLSPNELLRPNPIFTEALMTSDRNQYPTSSSSDRNQYPTSSDRNQYPTSSSDRNQYPTPSSSDSTQDPTPSSSDRTQYPTPSSSDRTQYPTSPLGTQYAALVTSVFTRRRAQKMLRNARHTSMVRVPRSKYRDACECNSNPIQSLGDCPICMEKLSGKVIGSTICGHVFCMSCLQRVVRTNKRCPTCRKMLKGNGYHKLFL